MPPRSEIPVSTYRLQFNRGFTFSQAREIVPYLSELGISHCYASPYFQASPDSTHGYDIANHNALNSAIGSRAQYDEWVDALHRHGMSQIVDFVPNHMGIAEPLNLWWMDVLENGRFAVHAPYFDIDWHPLKEGLEAKVMLPILGDQYGRVLEKGELKVHFQKGEFFVTYYESRLPLSPRTLGFILAPAIEEIPPGDARNELASILACIGRLPDWDEKNPPNILEIASQRESIKQRLVRLNEKTPAVTSAIQTVIARDFQGREGDSRSFDALDRLLDSQPYWLSFWRVAAEEINYRRFFDINNLAAIHIENPEVFQAAHRLLFELIESGAVNGLRIDHIDGLWNPRAYLEALQTRFSELAGSSGPRPLYLLVEKILGAAEKLRPEWPVHGTTGYDFTNQVTALLVDPAAERVFTETYFRFIGERTRLDDLIYSRKQLTMRLSLASEVNVLGHILDRLSNANRWFRDFTLNALTAAVREVIACFPVYRTYVEPGREPVEEDRQIIVRAVAMAKRRNPAMEGSIFDFLRDVLLLKFPENSDAAAREEQIRFVMKFQQCTGPIMAKGLEDTAFYVFNRLTALNEVGGDPGRFGAVPADFHKQNAARLESLPHAMLATSTHDTKRSEDVRARIAALSEIAPLWRRSLARWRSLNRKRKRDVEGVFAPDANEEYLLYQVLLGTWPLERAGDEEHAVFVSRIQDYMTKAIKEAKVNSSWVEPNKSWDEAARAFIAAILDRSRRNRFLEAFQPVAEQIAQLGALNSLSQTLLKCSVPGVPDIYQGTEIWDFSLVDPDNRRPVDYAHRREMLASSKTATPAELLAHWRDGRIKLFVLWKMLDLRRSHPALFAAGDYLPLETSGVHNGSCVAFRREHEGSTLIVIAPRLTARVGFPPVGPAWADTAIQWPGPPLSGARDLFTGREMPFPAGPIPVSELLSTFPVGAFLAGRPI